MSATHTAADLTVQSDLAEARRVQTVVEDALAAAGYGESDLFSIKLALEEALVNAIKHGNQLDPTKRVFISYRITPTRFDIRITDEGAGFNPEELPDPTDPENLEKSCGRGVFLIRNFMTEVQYHGRGNTVTMAKVRDPLPAAS